MTNKTKKQMNKAQMKKAKGGNDESGTKTVYFEWTAPNADPLDGTFRIPGTSKFWCGKLGTNSSGWVEIPDTP